MATSGSRSADKKSDLTPSQSKLLILFSAFTIGTVVILTLVLTFHYPTASDTTSVLGVIVPIFTAVIGVIVGGGAGLATGSAGKGAVQHDLDTSNSKIESAQRELNSLDTKIAGAFDTIRQNLTSRQGSLKLVASPDSGNEPIADLSELDGISSSIAHIQGILQ
jgi:hypothetical protein